MSQPNPSTAATGTKSKTRTSSSIPVMRSSGAIATSGPTSSALPRELPSNPSLPASHVVASVRSDRLEEEAARMEARLAALKVAMTTEKQQREQIKRTKVGTFWKGANPLEGDKKNYMEDVMARIEKRVAKANAAGNSARPTNTTAAQPQTTNKPPLGSKPTSSSSSSSNNTSDLAATVKSSYVPPIQPKNAVSAPSGPRLQASSSSNTTPRPPPATSNQPINSSRKPITKISSTINTASASNNPASPASSFDTSFDSYVNPADDENRSAAPGSLLDGDFDEQENKKWFAAARDEWIAETKHSSTVATSSAVPTKTLLVHDPDYSPAEQVPSSTGGNTLLDGPAFNERESAKEFQEARRAWIQALSEEKAGTMTVKHHKPKETAEQQIDNSDGMWNPSIALGQGGSILFPSDETTTAASSAADSHAAISHKVSTALRASQNALEKTAKSSCYNCYKLFYTNSGVTTRDFPGRSFCSESCLEQSAKVTKIRCQAPGCVKSVLRSEGRRLAEKEDQFFCQSCADNGGQVVVKPSPATAPDSNGPSVTSSLDSIPHASSPDIDDRELEGDDEDDAPDQVDGGSAEADADADYPPTTSSLTLSTEPDHDPQTTDDFTLIPEAASPAHHALQTRGRKSNTTSTTPPAVVTEPTMEVTMTPIPPPVQPQPKLDTSVIHQAANTNQPAAAPVVEFPSDDDE